jgi:CheY-like chemotaxis protein
VDRSLAVIEKSAQDGRETVRRIQEFSRVRRDRAQTPLDLTQIVRDSLELTQTRWEDDAASRNVAIQVEEFYKEVPPVLGHDSEFREVFMNLILNAIDAMPQGGILRVSCQLDGDRVVAEVGDSGVGMTEDIRRHLFDPFFSTKGTSGTGLGLSVVYGIVNRHHGTIDVETSPGRGTTFRVEFPAAFDAVLPEEDVMSEAPETTRTGHILVIDDDPAIAELLELTLQSVGHRVDVANSGAEGVRMAGAAEYDLIFSDLGMPDLSGWEVAEQIFRDKPAQPLILVTGWGATLEESELERRGITEVVHKPFDINDLIEVTARTITNS